MSVITLNPSAGERAIRRVELADITVSHNPRNPCAQLLEALVQEKFFHAKNGAVIPWTALELVRNLALGSDYEKALFVKLVEKYESEAKGIIELAKSRKECEIEPVVLRSFRVKLENGYEQRYGIVAGERRILAAAYNHAKHGTLATVGATIHKLTVNEAYNLAIEENSQRKDMTDLEYAEIFGGFLKQVNPQTERRWTLKQVAEKLNIDYQFVRGREALNYLPTAEKKRLADGKIGVTSAIQHGLEIKKGNKPAQVEDKKTNRRRALNLKQVETLFDENRDNGEEFLEALAVVMQISLKQAIKESDQRIDSE